VLRGFNDLATTHPHVATEADGWDPTTVTAGSNKKAAWRCQVHGHKWQTVIKYRTSGGHSCPICSGNNVLKGFNDLATTHPHIAAEADGWDPTTVIAGSHQKKAWRCHAHGHRWQTVVNYRTSDGNNCPSCAVSGYDPNEKGFFYFLEHPAWQLLQIGITNKPKDRLRDHELSGWVIREVQGPMDGYAAREVEQSALKALHRSGAVTAKAAKLEEFSGYTESWLKSSYPVKSLKEILDLVHQMESEELNNY
jgi:hypothetical protein